MATTVKVNTAEFEEQGYIHLKGFFSQAEIESLRDDIVTASGRLDKASGLNKDNMIFYSNLFQKSEQLRALATQPKVLDVLRAVAGPDLWIRWDQCVAKAPGAPPFPWHQDNAYNGVKDEYYQFWIAVTDMTADNGGVWLQPGSHQHGTLPHKRVENHWVSEKSFNNEILIDAAQGDAMLFSSRMLHHTKTNHSEADRWAYVIEYMSLDHFDPTVPGPYFVACTRDRQEPGFVKSYRGSRSVRNRIRYAGLSAEILKYNLKQRFKR
ncbi:MAG: phytanoyl-CoA dioxygenase family protein [Verrucomicrobia bacterium]|nr:phytanoyl-CoA dioxygenase family protein [Verrucomicrobiota bacterium]